MPIDEREAVRRLQIVLASMNSPGASPAPASTDSPGASPAPASTDSLGASPAPASTDSPGAPASTRLEMTLDRAAVRRVDAPLPGFYYGLRLGQANALLFMPHDDIDADEWPARLRTRLEEARRYLEQFPLSRVR